MTKDDLKREDSARALIKSWLRQVDGGQFPERLGSTPALAALVTEARAQEIYEEEIKRLEIRGAKAPRGRGVSVGGPGERK